MNVPRTISSNFVFFRNLLSVSPSFIIVPSPAVSLLFPPSPLSLSACLLCFLASYIHTYITCVPHFPGCLSGLPFAVCHVAVGRGDNGQVIPPWCVLLLCVVAVVGCRYPGQGCREPYLGSARAFASALCWLREGGGRRVCVCLGWFWEGWQRDKRAGKQGKQSVSGDGEGGS